VLLFNHGWKQELEQNNLTNHGSSISYEYQFGTGKPVNMMVNLPLRDAAIDTLQNLALVSVAT